MNNRLTVDLKIFIITSIKIVNSKSNIDYLINELCISNLVIQDLTNQSNTQTINCLNNNINLLITINDK